ncbi:uncharacterized protein LOC108412119 [Pygocentrus nattereri]|uniref:uncharacterized protein LOC108412119 n=1 Tax=Pygocentrus nattereri TaxID=42514 RepID=UPI001891C397|nr:uncharacterized protein LOC108412119 [Pygocentrus nattereri]
MEKGGREWCEAKTREAKRTMGVGPPKRSDCSVDVERVPSPAFSYSSTASGQSHEEPINFNQLHQGKNIILSIESRICKFEKLWLSPDQRIQNLALREKNLAEKQDLRLKNMDLREQNLDLREKKLVEKQNQWEKNMNLREKNLVEKTNQREKDLDLREKNLAQREKKLAEELDQWEKNLDLREQNLAKNENWKEENLYCTTGPNDLSQPKYNTPTTGPDTKTGRYVSEDIYGAYMVRTQ